MKTKEQIKAESKEYNEKNRKAQIEMARKDAELRDKAIAKASAERKSNQA